ncbi:MAG: nitroreductase family protein [Planctomycetota bacterium]
MSKRAITDHEIHELIATRWSPYGFQDRAVPVDDLRALLEAARWAPSSYNEQPWSFIVATREDADAHARALSCLVEANQAWARAVPVLLLCCTSLQFRRTGKPNGVALHDLGLAAANLSLEATSRGLAVHQMAGILPGRIRELYAVPAGVQPVTAIAVGYAAAPETLPETLGQRDTAPRGRRPLADFVFGAKWGESSPLV